MKPGAALMERFEGWFVSPIEKLKELPEGDGGFLALSAALFLCERYYRAKTNTHEKKKSPLFMKAAAQDMGLSLIDFNRFWQVYRNGMLHQGMPKRYIDPSSNITFRAHTDARFTSIPTFVRISRNTREIRLDPWKFAELIISKFKNNPLLLKKAVSHAFAEVVQC